MLKTKVLAAPITNLTDARYFAAQEVEWLGFELDSSSEDFIEPRAMSAIREWVDGVQIMGLFQLMEASEIREAIDQLVLDAVLLGMAMPIETAIQLQAAVPVFKEVVVEKTTTAAELAELLANWKPFVNGFVLNFTKNGINWAMINEGNPLSVSFLTKLCENFLIVLGIDSQLKMLNNILNLLHLYGFCVKGGTEEKVGYKSFDELDEIFELLEA